MGDRPYISVDPAGHGSCVRMRRGPQGFPRRHPNPRNRRPRRRRRLSASSLRVACRGALVPMPEHLRNPKHRSAARLFSARRGIEGWTKQDRESMQRTSLRKRERDWLIEHSTEYAGQWVALDGGQLVAEGSRARDVLEKARALGHDQPLLVHVAERSALP